MTEKGRGNLYVLAFFVCGILGAYILHPHLKDRALLYAIGAVWHWLTHQKDFGDLPHWLSTAMVILFPITLAVAIILLVFAIAVSIVFFFGFLLEKIYLFSFLICGTAGAIIASSIGLFFSEEERSDSFFYYLLYPVTSKRAKKVKVEKPITIEKEPVMKSNLPEIRTNASLQLSNYDKGALDTAVDGIAERFKLRTETKNLQQRIAYLKERNEFAELVFKTKMAEFKVEDLQKYRELERLKMETEMQRQKEKLEYEREMQRLQLEEKKLELEQKRIDFELKGFERTMSIERQEIVNQQMESRIQKPIPPKPEEDPIEKVKDNWVKIEKAKNQLKEMFKGLGYSNEEIEERLLEYEEELRRAGIIKGGVY